MRTNGRKLSVRRKPKQRRAQQTVEAVLDAVVKILKRDGVDAVTTNRIAEVAGVSVGSVYQYFFDKRAIFLALHDRHVEEIGRLVERTLVGHAASSLEDVLRALVEAVVDAHAPDPELYELLHTEAPHRSDGAWHLAERLRGALRPVISSRIGELKNSRDLERVLFVVTHMVDALSHGAALRRPPQISLAVAKEEAVRATLAYLGA
jgi:AcrR family transcriptional regulator